MTARTVLVTGAAGFIGSHTTEALCARGDHVIGLDNFNDYYDPGRKRANVAEMRLGSDAFELVEGDLRDRRLVTKLFEQRRFDAVVHLAAMAGVRASTEDPWLYYDVNLTGTLNLLDAAARTTEPVFVFASTSSAYGNTTQIPFDESDPADRPLAPYPASKRAAELLGHSYHHLHGTDFTALRFFTVYGPRGRPDMMPFKVLRSIFAGDEIPFYEGGQMHRDWTYVSDVVSAVVAASTRRLGYEIINIGRGEPVLVKEFVDHMERLAERPANLVERPMPPADVRYTFAKIDKARKLLDYDPHVSVAEGTRSMIEWYRRAVVNPGNPGA